jgi:hypothetical protein
MLRSTAPYVLLYGQENEFNLSLSSALEKSGLRVNICKNRQNFIEENIPHKTHEYAVYPVYETVHFEDVIAFIKENQKTKTLVILPYLLPDHFVEAFSSFVSDLKKLLPAIGILYCSSPIYPNQTSLPYPLSQQSGVLQLPSESSVLSFIEGEHLTNQILRNLFSLRAYGHQQAIVGSVLSSQELSHLLTPEGVETSFSPEKYNEFFKDVESMSIPMDKNNLVTVICSLYKSIPIEEPAANDLEVPSSAPLELPKPTTHTAKNRKVKSKRIKWIIFAGMSCLLLPYLISFCMLFLSSLCFSTSTTRLCSPLNDTLHGISRIGATVSRTYLQNGILERVYGDSLTMNTIVQRVTSANTQYNEASNDTLATLQKVTKGD